MVLEALRKALLAGFGVQERLKEVVDDFIKRGELSEAQGAKLVKEWTEKAEKTTTDLDKSISDAVTRALEKMNIATRVDLNNLEKKHKALAAKVRKLEGKKG